MAVPVFALGSAPETMHQDAPGCSGLRTMGVVKSSTYEVPDTTARAAMRTQLLPVVSALAQSACVAPSAS